MTRLAIAVLSVSVGAIWVGVQLNSVPSFYYSNLILMAASTMIGYFVLDRVRIRAPEDFSRVYLGSVVGRILFFSGYMFFVIVQSKSAAPANTVSFLVFYLLFTVLEISFLYIKVNR